MTNARRMTRAILRLSTVLAVLAVPQPAAGGTAPVAAGCGEDPPAATRPAGWSAPLRVVAG